MSPLRHSEQREIHHFEASPPSQRTKIDNSPKFLNNEPTNSHTIGLCFLVREDENVYEQGEINSLKRFCLVLLLHYASFPSSLYNTFPSTQEVAALVSLHR